MDDSRWKRIVERVRMIRFALLICLLGGVMTGRAFGADEMAIKVEDAGDGVRKWTVTADGDPRPAFFRRLEQISNIDIRDPENLPFGRSVAFLIGVGRYTNLPALPHAAVDIEKLREYLLTAGGFDAVYMAMDEAVTPQLIETYMEKMFPKALGAADRLLFYFAGHGCDAGGAGHMRFSNADLTKCDPENSLPVSVCEKWDAALPVRHALFIFDCCCSGVSGRTENSGDARAEIRNTFAGQGSRMAIVACEADQRAFQVGERGVFAKALLSAFYSGSHTYGFLTARQIFSRLDFRVKKSALKAGTTLTPRCCDLDPDRSGAFLFLNAGIRGIELPPWVVRRMTERRSPDDRGTGVVKVTTGLAGVLIIDGQVEATLTAGESLDSVLDAGTRRIEFQGKTFRFRKEVLVESGKTHEVFIRTESAGKPPKPVRDAEPPKRRVASEQVKATEPEACKPESEDVDPRTQIIIREPRTAVPVPPESLPEAAPQLEAPLGEAPPEPRFRNSLGMNFVYLPPGAFAMGTSYHDPARKPDETPHQVELTRGIYMQTTEVTKGQWRAFAEATGYQTEAETQNGAFGWTGGEWAVRQSFDWRNPGFPQTDDHPVTCVSWNDAMALVSWLSERDGCSYDLPTEAEWEYACRAGAAGRFAFGSCLSSDQANYDGTFHFEDCPAGRYREGTVPAGLMAANAWGLHDMHGNVWEWCRDYYGPYPMEMATDPAGPPDEVFRVVRGGSWGHGASECRCADRHQLAPAYRVSLAGFRVVMRPAAREWTECR